MSLHQAARRQGTFFFFGSSVALFGGLVIKLCCLLSALRGKDAYRPEWLQKGSRRPLPCGPPPWDRVFPKNSHSSCWMGKQTRKQQGERGVQHAIPCTPHSPHPPHTAPRAARQPQQVRPLVSVQCRAVQCPGTWQGWIFLYHWFNICIYIQIITGLWILKSKSEEMLPCLLQSLLVHWGLIILHRLQLPRFPTRRPSLQLLIEALEEAPEGNSEHQYDLPLVRHAALIHMNCPGRAWVW